MDYICGKGLISPLLQQSGIRQVEEDGLMENLPLT